MRFSHEELLRQLASIQGCLSAQRTTEARRRCTENEGPDEDLLIPGVDPFLVDAESKLASSKATRRLLDKTQVVADSNNLHVRRRITHTGEVTAIASMSAAILGLNVELTKAIALGHDIGHAPFGHDGEKFLREVSGRNFLHEVMGVVIAQHVERRGRGLNLTYQTLSGMLRDTESPLSPEAQVVMHADRIAYVTGDFSDLRRIQYPVPKKLGSLMNSLGVTQRERVNALMGALCLESAEVGCVTFGESEVSQVFLRAKALMYEIYQDLNASNANSILEKVYAFLKKVVRDADPVLLLALMTDHDVMYLVGYPVLDWSRFMQVTVAELLPTLREREIRWWEPDLDW